MYLLSHLIIYFEYMTQQCALATYSWGHSSFVGGPEPPGPMGGYGTDSMAL